MATKVKSHDVGTRTRSEYLSLWLALAVCLLTYTVSDGVVKTINETISTYNTFIRVGTASDFWLLYGKYVPAQILMTLMVLVFAISIWGIWSWKKWGVIGSIVFGIIALLYNLAPTNVAFEPYQSPFIVPFFAVIALYIGVSQRWEDFQ